jgi:hypothetical protein
LGTKMTNLGIDFRFLPRYNLLTKPRSKCERGNIIMTENKLELIKLILENDNPEDAIMTAAAIIYDLLKQHEASEELSSACL